MVRTALSASALLALSVPALAQQFMPISVPGASVTRARAISNDGAAVVGDSTVGAWRWRSSDGLQLLGVPLGGAEPTDVANQGAGLVGINGVSGSYGFAWTQAAGAVGLATLAGSVQRNPVINELGTTVFGNNGAAAYRWDPVTGLRGAQFRPTAFNPLPLGATGCCPPGTVLFNTVVASNPDGTGGAGQILEQASARNSKGCIPGSICAVAAGAGVWIPPAAPHILATSSGTLQATSPPVGASRDLTRILFPDALWDTAVGYQSFIHPLGYSLTRISGDGHAIVAVPAIPSPTNEGKLWLQNRGYVSIRVLLTESGCQFDGWTTLVVTGVNTDGRRVCGYGLDPAGQTSGWFATLRGPCWGADFDRDGDVGTDADIEAFFACLAGSCCPTCGSADFDRDGSPGTDADIEDFFRALAGLPC